jgi:hypothetical protein
LDKGAQDDNDPLQAVLNRSWSKQTTKSEDKQEVKRKPVAMRHTVAHKPSDSVKADDSRNRLSTSGNGLFVDTQHKSLALPVEPSPRPGEVPEASPPLSPFSAVDNNRRNLMQGLTKHGSDKAPERGRRYSFDISPVVETSPRLRSPPKVRAGSIKLDFDEDIKHALDDHGGAVVEDHHHVVDKEQQEFIDLTHKLESLVSQTALRMNDMLDDIRKKFHDDHKWLEAKVNYEQLTEVSFEVLTANYFLSKWHHQLEPRKVPAPPKPEKPEEVSCDDVLAQLQNSISRMEVLVSKLGPVMNKIISDARTLRRGPDGEPISPNSRNPVKLAAKRGFKDATRLHKLVEHLEHTLSVTHHLAHPPKSGMETFQISKKVVVAGSLMMAANRFKRGAMKNEKNDGKDAVAKEINAAFKSLGNAAATAATVNLSMIPEAEGSVEPQRQESEGSTGADQREEAKRNEESTG